MTAPAKHRTWEDGIAEYDSSLANSPSFRDGYRAGWLDCSLKRRSQIAIGSPVSRFSFGYDCGCRDRREQAPVRGIEAHLTST
jgi:hypothetical protein